MMISSINIQSWKIIEYEPNFEEFNNLTRIYHETALTARNQWNQVSSDQIQQYLTGALRAYSILNTRQWRLRNSIPDPDYDKLLDIGQDLLVPRFYRDVFREFSRPMIDGINVYIPKFESFKIPLDDHARYSTDLGLNIPPALRGRILRLSEELGLDMVPIDIDVIKPAELSICVEIDGLQLIAARAPIPEFRKLSLSVLRHIRFEQVNTAQLTVETSRPANEVSRILQSVFDSTTRGFASITDGFLTINGQRMWSFGNLPVLLPTLISDRRRFPTDEEHSATPPQSPFFRKGIGVENKYSKRKRNNKTSSIDIDSGHKDSDQS